MASTYRVRMVDGDGKPVTCTDDVEAPLPARFQVEPKGSEQWGHDLFVTLDRVGDELEITHLDIGRSATGPNVTASTLRQVDVSGALAACREAATSVNRAGQEWTGSRGQWATVSVIRDADMIEQMGLSGLRKIESFPPLIQDQDGTYRVEDGYTDRLRAAGPSSVETQTAVGWLYRFAQTYDMAPVQFIGQVLDVPARTASHWVKCARQSGKVPASTRRSRSDRRHA